MDFLRGFSLTARGDGVISFRLRLYATSQLSASTTKNRLQVYTAAALNAKVVSWMRTARISNMSLFAVKAECTVIPVFTHETLDP